MSALFGAAMRASRATVFMAAAMFLAFYAVHAVGAEKRISSPCGTLKRALRGSTVGASANSVEGPCEQLHGAILDEAVTSANSAKGPVNAEHSNQDGDDDDGDDDDDDSGGQSSPDIVAVPPGIWTFTQSSVVSTPAVVVWDTLKVLRTLFMLWLDELSASVTVRGPELVGVEFDGGSSLDFVETARDDEQKFLVFVMQNITENVFPGFDFTGVEIFVQIMEELRPDGDVAIIRMGRTDPLVEPGRLDVAVNVLDALVMELFLNLQRAFGETCEDFLDVRTIEGDCNNLLNPTQASAASALRRLGMGDPAYPGGDRSIPAGPLEINPRNISNALFATSPGASLVSAQAQTLQDRCTRGTTEGTAFLVCPFRFVTVTPSQGEEFSVPFDSLRRNRFQEIVFVFQSDSCTIRAPLKCSGETRVDFATDPCDASTNRFFTPVACAIIPGEDSVLANSDNLTDLFFSFGQFIDHDVGLSPLSQLDEMQPGFSRLAREPVPSDINPSFPIEVPERDFFFRDREEFEFTRAQFSEEDPNSQVNLHSSYLDGSHIYGVNFRRSKLLRTGEGGKLRLSEDGLPPFNGVDSLGTAVENGPNMDSRFFVVGDSRGNEQTLLLCLHIIFIREHNRVADELAAAFPYYDDEDLYQTARAIIIAEFQCIVYMEWLPLLLGSTSPDPTEYVYDENLDATVSAVFTTAVFRLGHSMIGTNLLSLGSGPHSTADLELFPIRDVFFVPELVIDKGVDPFLRGGAWHLCKELDNMIVDEVRNFLTIEFEPEVTTPPNFDLVSLNLQRGRDIGLPSYNVVRGFFGLEPRTSFSFISNRNLADLASDVYEDVNVAELFFGGLAEDQLPGSQLGETFNTIVADQFTRLRDGDRFFYTGFEFPQEVIDEIPVVQEIIDNEVRLADVILRNTDITATELGSRDSVFQV